MRATCQSAILAFAILLSLPAWAQDAYVPLEQRLTPEQRRETGLDGLSAAQLERLNALLRAEQAAVVSRERLKDKPERGGLLGRDQDPIVSRIAGEFRGWRNGTRFELENGQTWRVIDTPEFYVPTSKFVASPAVTLTPGMFGGWYMQVQGQSVRAKVQQVN
jgi:hypothetical protein